LAVA
jgi:hypothetical protein